MGSSAQNSSVVHWCRRRVRFNEVPEKVPEVRGFVQSQVRFNRLLEKVPEREALVQSRVKFNRVPDKVPEKVLEKVLEKVPGSLDAKPSQAQQGPEKVPEKVLEGFGDFGAEPGQVQQGPEKVPEKVWEALHGAEQARFWRRSGRLWCKAGSRLNRVPNKVLKKVPVGFGAEPGHAGSTGEGSGEGLGGFGAEPGQVQQGSGEGSRASTGFRRRFQSFNRVQEALVQGQVQVPEEVPEKAWKAVVQSQVRFNRVSEKVREKVWEAFWCRAGSGSTGFRRRFRRRSGRLWCRARSGSTGFRRRFRRIFQEALVLSQVRFNRFKRVSSASLCSTLQKDL